MLELYTDQGLLTKFPKEFRIMFQPGERVKLYMPSVSRSIGVELKDLKVDCILEMRDRTIIMLSPVVTAPEPYRLGNNGE